MADLASTRVFGKLTVMHEAIVKANAEIVGDITASKFIGDGSQLTALSWGQLTSVPATATRWPAWGEVTGKPSTFAPTSHTHPLSQITGAGNLAALNTNASTSNFLRGDGTWATPPNTNTTYSEITTAEIDTGTASTARAISGRRMKYALDKKADVSHTHSLSQITDAGNLASLSTNASTSNFLRGDGTWTTPPNTNTTYSEITTAEIDAGTATTLRTITGRRMKHALDKKVDTTTQVIAGTGLSGGGTLAANRTLSVNYGTAAGTAAQGNDSRLSDSREWTASAVTQAEAEAGTATTARKWTAQRVRQAILGWWNSSSDKTKLDGIAAGAQVNVATNLGSSGTGATRTITSSTGSNTSITYSAADVGAVPTARTITAGDGLSGGGTLAANRTVSVDGTVVRTSGNQSITGNKEFSTGFFGGIATSYGNLSSLVSGGTSAGDMVTGLRIVNTGTSAATKARVLFTLTTNAAWENVSLEADRFSGSNMRFNIGIGDGANPPTNIAQFYSDRAEINGNLILGEQGTTTAQAVRADRTITAGTGLSGGGNLTANRTLSVNYGTTAGTAAQGNDSRLSDSREWTASAVTQAEAEAGTATTARKWTAQRVSQAISALGLKIGTTATTAKAGNWMPTWANVTGKPTTFTPASHTHSLSEVTDAGNLAALNTNASTSNFLRGDGTWATPPNTNTTYTEITTAEIDAGTASTLRTISGRRMKYALDKKADATHTHALSQITDAGSVAGINTNGSTANYLRGDGTWVTPPNTTYSAMSVAEGTAGTVTSSRTMRADHLKQIVNNHIDSAKVANNADTTQGRIITTGYLGMGDTDKQWWPKTTSVFELLDGPDRTVWVDQGTLDAPTPDFIGFIKVERGPNIGVGYGLLHATGMFSKDEYNYVKSPFGVTYWKKDLIYEIGEWVDLLPYLLPPYYFSSHRIDGNYPPSVRLMPDGEVQMRGVVDFTTTSGAPNGPAFRVPEPFRPLRTQSGVCFSDANPMWFGTSTGLVFGEINYSAVNDFAHGNVSIINTSMPAGTTDGSIDISGIRYFK